MHLFFYFFFLFFFLSIPFSLTVCHLITFWTKLRAGCECYVTCMLYAYLVLASGLVAFLDFLLHVCVACWFDWVCYCVSSSGFTFLLLYIFEKHPSVTFSFYTHVVYHDASILMFLVQYGDMQRPPGQNTLCSQLSSAVTSLGFMKHNIPFLFICSIVFF